jgi:hypothetical protein
MCWSLEISVATHGYYANTTVVRPMCASSRLPPQSGPDSRSIPRLPSLDAAGSPGAPHTATPCYLPLDRQRISCRPQPSRLAFPCLSPSCAFALVPSRRRLAVACRRRWILQAAPRCSMQTTLSIDPGGARRNPLISYSVPPLFLVGGHRLIWRGEGGGDRSKGLRPANHRASIRAE